MLAELARLRALVAAQAEALAAGDLSRLGELDAERMAIQARIDAGAWAALSSAERAEASELAQAIVRGHDELSRRAAEARGRLRGQLAALGAGRDALAAYRPPAAGRSLYLDRSR